MVFVNKNAFYNGVKIQSFQPTFGEEKKKYLKYFVFYIWSASRMHLNFYFENAFFHPCWLLTRVKKIAHDNFS